MNIGYGFIEQAFKVCVFIRYAGRFLTETPGYHLHITENHFGVLNKIAVHSDTVFIGIKVYPIRFNIYDTVTLLQDKNIRYYLCASVTLKGVIR